MNFQKEAILSIAQQDCRIFNDYIGPIKAPLFTNPGFV